MDSIKISKCFIKNLTNACLSGQKIHPTHERNSKINFQNDFHLAITDQPQLSSIKTILDLLSICQVMTSKPRFVSPATTLTYVADIFLQEEFPALPVVENSPYRDNYHNKYHPIPDQKKLRYYN